MLYDYSGLPLTTVLSLIYPKPVFYESMRADFIPANIPGSVTVRISASDLFEIFQIESRKNQDQISVFFDNSESFV